MIRSFRSLLAPLTLLALLASAAPALAQLKPIELPKPQTTGGKPLMEVLNQRQTTRAFADKPLVQQQLSNLLWAAFGVNRPAAEGKKPGHTAPSGNNKQEIQIYVILATGAFLYDTEKNLLAPVAEGDLRATVGPASTPAAKAAVTLLYVAPTGEKFSQVDTGFIAQNAYLYAASEGLNAWFRLPRDPALGPALKLDDKHEFLYAQSFGYPAQ